MLYRVLTLGFFSPETHSPSIFPVFLANLNPNCRINWLMHSLAEQSPQSLIEKVSRNSHTHQIAAKIAWKILFLTEREEPMVEPVVDEPPAFFRVYSKK